MPPTVVVTDALRVNVSITQGESAALEALAVGGELNIQTIMTAEGGAPLKRILLTITKV